MSHRLELPLAFLKSPHLPRRCLLTGRSDNIQRISCTLRRALPPWLVVASYFFVVPALYLFVIVFRTREVPLPLSQEAWSESRSRRILPQTILAVGMLVGIGCIVHALTAKQPGGWEYACFSLSLYAGLGLAALLHQSLSRNQVSVHLNRGQDGILVQFPDTREEQYQIFAKAFEQFTLERPAVDAFNEIKRPPPREDDFVEQVPPGWDESESESTTPAPATAGRRRGPFAMGVEIRLPPRPVPPVMPAAPPPPPPSEPPK